MLEAFANKSEVGGGVFNPNNLNPYSYGYNNPVVFDDPDGRCPVCLIFVLFGGGVAIAPTGDSGDAQKVQTAKNLQRDIMFVAATGRGGDASTTVTTVAGVTNKYGGSNNNSNKKAETIIKNAKVGKKGELIVTKSLKKEFKGDVVLNQVTGKFSDGKTTKFDNIVVDRKTAQLKLINETKTGNAKFTKPQNRFYKKGESVTLTGKNAGPLSGQKINSKTAPTRETRIKREDIK